MKLDWIDPLDDQAYASWFDLWHLTDRELWPDVPGWNVREIRAMAARRGRARHHLLLAARTDAGQTVGAALVEWPLLDNVHSVGLDVRVHPDHRRRGVGRLLVEAVSDRAAAEGRTRLNAFVEVPSERLDGHPSDPFARHLGFEEKLVGHRRHLAVPLPAERLAQLQADAVARGAGAYRILTFVTPWPEEFLDDQCTMARAMSTDEPSGDEHHEEEHWDAERVHEADALLVAQGLTKLAAVAQDPASGRLVAFSELVISESRPTEAWQWATLVLRQHRGHALGLAVKVANLVFLDSVLPTARRVITGNAQENAPMIAVNDQLGFEVVATGRFWQKELSRP